MCHMQEEVILVGALQKTVFEVNEDAETILGKWSMWPSQQIVRYSRYYEPQVDF